jgi:hypothetical protein
MSKKLTNKEIKEYYFNMERRLENICYFRETDSTIKCLFREPYNQTYNNIDFGYNDRDRAVRFIYNYFKGKDLL